MDGCLSAIKLEVCWNLDGFSNYLLVPVANPCFTQNVLGTQRIHGSGHSVSCKSIKVIQAYSKSGGVLKSTFHVKRQLPIENLGEGGQQSTWRGYMYQHFAWKGNCLCLTWGVNNWQSVNHWSSQWWLSIKPPPLDQQSIKCRLLIIDPLNGNCQSTSPPRSTIDKVLIIDHLNSDHPSTPPPYPTDFWLSNL